jgi:hypothetical protein
MMIGAAASAALFAAGICGATAAAAGGGPNVRVTLDQGSSYVSADQLAGGTYTDGVLSRCGTDRRMQNEPTLAIDPRDHSIWTAGSNDYCTVPTAGDAWAGFYRSTDGGGSWTDSLLPGYHGDTSAQGTSSPLAALVAGGALAQPAHDPDLVPVLDLDLEEVGRPVLVEGQLHRGIVSFQDERERRGPRRNDGAHIDTRLGTAHHDHFA